MVVQIGGQPVWLRNRSLVTGYRALDAVLGLSRHRPRMLSIDVGQYLSTTPWLALKRLAPQRSYRTLGVPDVGFLVKHNRSWRPSAW